MSRDEIRRRLLELLASGDFSWTPVDVSTVTDDTSVLNQTTFDSLQLLELVVAIENAFGFRARADSLSIEMFDRLGSVIDFIERSREEFGAERRECDAAHTA